MTAYAGKYQGVLDASLQIAMPFGISEFQGTSYCGSRHLVTKLRIESKPIGPIDIAQDRATHCDP